MPRAAPHGATLTRRGPHCTHPACRGALSSTARWWLLEALALRRLATRQPVNEDTVFRIASMTKSFTALAILALRDEGTLSLDDPAGKYLPALAAMPPPMRDAPAITIRQLLTHSAGFPEDNPLGRSSARAAARDAHVVGARGPALLNLARHGLRAY